MQERLVTLLEQIGQNDRTALSPLYKLTSAHLYGVIFRILRNDVCAQKVLKSVYLQIWDERHEPPQTDPLTELRALAHRQAIDYKFKNKSVQTPKQDNHSHVTVRFDRLQRVGIEDDEIMLLKDAYLNACPVEVLAEERSSTVEDIQDRLASIASKLVGGAS